MGVTPLALPGVGLALVPTEAVALPQALAIQLPLLVVQEEIPADLVVQE